MVRTSLTRRGFIGSAASHAGAVAAARVVGGSIVLTAAGTRYAYALEALGDGQAAVLLATARTLFPHERLGEEVYAAVVASLDTDAAADPDVLRMLADGIDALNDRAGGDFVDADASERAASLKDLEGTPFFGAMHFKAVSTIYDRPDVWATLGYEGPSHEHGGYIHRGFDALEWLPDPPPEASGPVDA